MRTQAQEDNVCPDFIAQYYRIFLINEKFQAPCKRTQHGWVLHFASVCTPCCMLLTVTASVLCTPLKHGRNNTQQSVVIIVGATMLGVVASVCT